MPPKSTTAQSGGGSRGTRSQDKGKKKDTTPPTAIPQDSLNTSKVPRPAEWEPVDLKTTQEYFLGDLEYFNEINEGLAKEFKEVPTGYEVNENLDDDANEETLQALAKEHADYGRLKVHKRKLEETGWSKDADFDDRWQAQYILGAGTFGRVGLWIRRDENNEIVDEMAIKEEGYTTESLYYRSTISGCPDEAIHNEIMNRDGEENIQQLRGFKSFVHSSEIPARNGDNRKWRYYFEYAPYGPLERLIARYRAWNQYLPESFLWHVFDGLAKILVAFDETVPPHAEHKKGKLKPDYRMIHFDIKPNNIFLGYEQPFNTKKVKYGGHAENVYPMIKIGDFGVSAFTGRSDPGNPTRFWQYGTPYYIPPEEMHYGLAFPIPPNGESVPLQDELGRLKTIEEAVEIKSNPRKVHFTQPMNVWGIGKVMYDLVTLSHDYDYAEASTQRYDEYQKWNKNAIEDFQNVPFIISNSAKSEKNPPQSPYSKDLMALIEQCMKPAADDRIAAQAVKDTTAKVLSRFGSSDTLAMNEKVYFRGNEINDMPAGSENFVYFNGGDKRYPNRGGPEDFADVMKYAVDPDEPELQPPRWPEKLRKYKAKQKKTKEAPNKYWMKHCRIENGKIIFHDSGKDKANATEQEEAADTQAEGADTDTDTDGNDDGAPGSSNQSTTEVDAEMGGPTDEQVDQPDEQATTTTTDLAAHAPPINSETQAASQAQASAPVQSAAAQTQPSSAAAPKAAPKASPKAGAKAAPKAPGKGGKKATPAPAPVPAPRKVMPPRGAKNGEKKYK